MCKRAKMFKLCSVRSFLTKVSTIVRIFVPNSHSHLFNKLAHYIYVHIYLPSISSYSLTDSQLIKNYAHLHNVHL